MTDKLEMGTGFLCSDETIRSVATSFCQALENRLAGRASSLSALNSYMKRPTGDEQGVFLALDFGGTNVRVSRIRLLGKHCYVIEKKIARPLRLSGKYDYTTEETTKDELFDFLADCVAAVAGRNSSYKLGHTFSFAVRQDGPQDAQFSAWAKEIRVQGMEGVMINDALRQALLRRGLDHIEPVALLNDTTAALLAASYQQDNAMVSIICGTGYNMCYYEPALGTIINLEAGCFDGAEPTPLDRKVDRLSEIPGDHRFEKMVGGRYLGEIFSHFARVYYEVPSLKACTAEDMSHFIGLGSTKERQLFLSHLWQRIVREHEVQIFKMIAESLFVRSAQLAGGACAGILYHLYPQGSMPEQFIAVEGSIMEKVVGSMPVFETSLLDCIAVDEQGWVRPVPVHSGLVQDGPSVGAAVAAAMVGE